MKHGLGFFVVCLGLRMCGVTAWGQQYFSDAGGPLAWDNATANWGAASGGPYDSVWTNGDAVFEGTAGTVNLDTVSANSLMFGVGGYTLTNGALTLTGPLIVANSGATIASVISGTAGLTKGGTGGTLTLSGVNTYSGGTTISGGTLAVSADNRLGASGEGITLAGGTLRNSGTLNTTTRPLTLGAGGGVISLGTYLNYNGTITGGSGLAVSGSDFILNPPSANDIGSLTLTGSRLFVNNANAIANNASLAITGGGRLVFQGGTAPTAPANAITFASGCGVGMRSNASGDLTLSTTNAVFPAAGTFVFNNDDQTTRGVTIIGDWPTLTGALTIQVGGGSSTAVGTTTFGCSVSGSGSLTKTGSGTLVLAVSNSFSGGVSAAAGTVRLGDDNALGSSSAVLTVLNGGTLDLAGHSPRVTGLTDTLGYGATGTGMITNSGAEATIAVTRAGVAFGGVIAGPINLVIPTGGSNYQILSGNSTYTGLTTIYSSLETWGTNALGSTAVGTVLTNSSLSMKGKTDPMVYAPEPLMVYGSSSFSLNTDDALRNPSWTGPITLASGSLLSISGGKTNCTITIPSIVSGAGAITKSTSVLTLMLSGDNTYSGGTTLTAGTLKLGSATALGTGAVTLSAGLIDLNGTSPTVGSLSGASAGAIVDTSEGSGTTTFTVHQTANTTCSSTISNGVSKTVAFTETGTGVLTLNATNTFTGAFTVSGGTLRLGMTNALPGNATVTSGGTLDLNALNLNNGTRLVVIAGPGAAGTSGALANTGGGTEALVYNLTLDDDATIGTTGSKLNVYGTLNGGGHVLTVAGTGEINVRPNNDFANLAGVTINSGLLRLESNQNWPGTYTVNAGGKLDTYGSGRYEAGNVFLNGGRLVNGGTGQMPAYWSGAFSLAGTGVVDTTGGNITISNAVSGTGALTVLGTNTLFLCGTNTFGGALCVSNGTVTLNGSLVHANIAVVSNAVFNGSGTLHARVANGTSDTLAVQGTANLAGLSLDLDVSSLPRGGAPYLLVDASNGSLVGRFAHVADVPAGYAVAYYGNTVQLVASGTVIQIY